MADNARGETRSGHVRDGILTTWSGESVNTSTPQKPDVSGSTIPMASLQCPSFRLSSTKFLENCATQTWLVFLARSPPVRWHRSCTFFSSLCRARVRRIRSRSREWNWNWPLPRERYIGAACSKLRRGNSIDRRICEERYVNKRRINKWCVQSWSRLTTEINYKINFNRALNEISCIRIKLKWTRILYFIN